MMLFLWSGLVVGQGRGFYLSYCPHSLVISKEGEETILPLAIHNLTSKERKATIRCLGVGCSPFGRATDSDTEARTFPAPLAAEVNIPPYEACAVFLKLPVSLPSQLELEIESQGERINAKVDVIRGMDLSALTWRRKYDPQKKGEREGYYLPSLDTSDWQPFRPPALWYELGDTWCSVRFKLPENMRGKALYLIIGAIDDNDVTYFNGEKIGATVGWDVLRTYKIPANLVREENVLTMKVENVNAGGGLYKLPILIAEKPFQSISPWRVENLEPPKPRPIGKPQPIRPIRIEDGLLVYPDGKEVALWGTNIYPQSWYQYSNVKKLGLDPKKVIDEDFEHLTRMGVNVIRMHIFEKEIADEKGDLIENEHLDLLDYVIYKCQERGIYLFLTPIAWWWSPVQIPGCFSDIPKENMPFREDVIEKTCHYFREFLTRRNPYTKKMYKDHLGLFALEIMNEPVYFTYEELEEGKKPGSEEQRETWQRWCEGKGIPPRREYFPLFRYERVSHWLAKCYLAIRNAGAKQIVCAPGFGALGEEDLCQAIYLSPCEGVTYGAYPGGWAQMNDSRDMLEEVDGNYRWLANALSDSRFARKARLVYEFDAPALLRSVYVYPLIACMFRSLGTQVACQFQYDTVATAEFNSDWWNHYLNYLYTPGKAVSYIIAGETFRSLPRFYPYPSPSLPLRERVFDGFAVSFPYNISLMSRNDAWMNSNEASWLPLPLPRSPKILIGVGSSPFVKYDGTGLYRIVVGKKEIEIEVNPDAEINPKANPMATSLEQTLTRLEWREHSMEIRLGGKVYRLKVKPGTYRIKK